MNSFEDFEEQELLKKEPIDVSKLDPRYKTEGKDWEIKGDRHTITTKKEILQRDYKKRRSGSL